MDSDSAHFFLRDLALILGTAALATVVFQRFRLPVIVGYIVAGMLVGPLAPLPLVHDSETIRTLAELGVVLLLFSIGLEFRFRKLVALGPRVALAAMVEIGLLLLLGYGAARVLGWTPMASLFAAGIVAISSTMVVSRTLDDLRADRRLRDIVFGVLVMEDLVAIILIALLTTVASGADISSGMLGETLGRLGLFLLLLIVGGMLVIPRAVNFALSFRRPETTLVAALGICLGLAVLSVAAGYSVALGGFLAGTLVAESGKHRIVEEVVRPVRDLFAAIFFVAVGMLFQPAVLAEVWVAALVLTLVVLLGKLVGVTAGVFLAGYGTRDAIRAGMSLAQIGEFSFVIAGLGAVTSTSSGQLYAVAVAVATVTAFTTPIFTRHADGFASWVDRHLPHPVQTVASLYASWVELLGTRKPASEPARLRTRYVRFLVLDAACVTAAIIGTSLLYRRMPGWIEIEADRAPGVRLALLAGGALLALPFAIGLVRTVRRLSGILAESALPKPVRGVDQGNAPRRSLASTLQIGMVIAIGVPVILLTLPFVPPFGVLGVVAAYLLILMVGFWRTATDLDKHTRAGAELVVHALAKQAHSGDTGTFEVVRELLPGMGTIVPLDVQAGSEAAGATLGDLNLRGRTGATVVALTRNGRREPLPTAATRLEPGDMVALSGSGNAIGLAAALLRARDTSSPRSAMAATAPPAG
ncbi:MAG TPA: cation:proton antiporter [Gemmatimonadales bacterium]|nr:cation:proton antiporter [Gemmatimonadales bacterium]